MSQPGAAMSTQLPNELKLVSEPLALVAATAMTSGYDAGNWTTSLPSLPAAATTTTPLDTAYLTASCRTGLSPGPPSDMLITLAPWSVAQVMPSAMSTS